MSRSLTGSLLASVMLAALVPATGAVAQAQSLLDGLDGRTLTPVPYNANPDIALELSVSHRQPRIGDILELCFAASRTGYVTLWNVGTSGQTARIFPNAYSGGDPGAMQVTGGQRYCAGKSGDPFRFRVDGPPGRDELYIAWTATPDRQPQTTGFPNPAAMASAFEAMRQQTPAGWATYKTAYEVVGPGGAAPPPVPPVNNSSTLPPPPPAPAPTPMPQAQQQQQQQPQQQQAQQQQAAKPQLYILAMGSNVEPLTKSNQDAAMFVDVFKTMFAIPNQNIRVYKDVYRNQFKAGMEWLQKMAQPQDFVVIYYSGHGAQIPDDNGDEQDGSDEAFVTFDVEGKASPSVRDLVRDDEYATWVNGLRTSQVLSVIDACHSGGMQRGVGDVLMGATPKFFIRGEIRPASGAPAARALGVPKMTPKGTTLAAAREDQSALEGSKGSIFTLALIESLAGVKKAGTMVDVFTTTSRRVASVTESKQTPVMTGERGTAERITISP